MTGRRWLGGLILAITVAAPGVLSWTTGEASGAATETYLGTLGGPGHAAIYPSGMEIVPAGAPNAGDIIVADTGNNQVAEYFPGGTQVWRVGSEGSSASKSAIQFEQPRDVGVNSSGNVYVADNGNGRVVELSSTGQYVNKWKSLPTGAAAPIGITVSDTTASLPNLPAGQRVYVSDGSQNEIAVWSTSGTFISAITSTGACQLNRMRDAVADAAGNVFVANYESNDILEFSWNGTAWACANSWGSQGSGNGQFMNPYGVTVGTDPFIAGGKPGEAIYVAELEQRPDPGVHLERHLRRPDGRGRDRQPAGHLHPAPPGGRGCQRRRLGRRSLGLPDRGVRPQLPGWR